MKQKLILVVLAVIIGGLFLWGYNAFLAPEGVSGEKDITLEIIIERENINETFYFNTEHEFLLELLKEQEDELQASFEEHELGTMLTGLMDIEAQDNEFYLVLVDGEQAERGIAEIPLQDEEIYTFELTEF